MSEANPETKDQIFREDGQILSDFVFDERVAHVFEDMIARSIPLYRENQSMTSKILGRHLDEGDRVLDLGCSTGEALRRLHDDIQDKRLSFLGVDQSESMILRARQNTDPLSYPIDYERADLLEYELPKQTGAALLQYTLQFLRPIQRTKFLRRIRRALRPGGALILSEKIISHDPVLNRSFIELYYDFKKSEGYSETEISKKREALENVLVPFSLEENIEILKVAGFSHVEPYFLWFNFASIVAIKDV